GLDPTLPLGRLDHGHADAVLDASPGVECLELGEQLHAVLRGRAVQHPRKLDKWGLPHELSNVDRNLGHQGHDNNGAGPGGRLALRRAWQYPAAKISGAPSELLHDASGDFAVRNRVRIRLYTRGLRAQNSIRLLPAVRGSSNRGEAMKEGWACPPQTCRPSGRPPNGVPPRPPNARTPSGRKPSYRHQSGTATDGRMRSGRTSRDGPSGERAATCLPSSRFAAWNDSPRDIGS